MELTDNNLKARILEERANMLDEVREALLGGDEDLLLTASRNLVSKKYKKLEKVFGVSIVFGEGGAQDDKVTKLEGRGADYVRISSKLFSRESDAR